MKKLMLLAALAAYATAFAAGAGPPEKRIATFLTSEFGLTGLDNDDICDLSILTNVR